MWLSNTVLLFFPGSWFRWAELFLWRLLLAADAISTGKGGLQEFAFGTTLLPTSLYFHCGSQPGRVTHGGAGGHAGSTTALPPCHLQSVRASDGQLLWRDDTNEQKDIAVIVFMMGSAVYKCLLLISKHDTGTCVSASRTIQCFIFSAKATVPKLDSVSFHLCSERFSKKRQMRSQLWITAALWLTKLPQPPGADERWDLLEASEADWTFDFGQIAKLEWEVVSSPAPPPLKLCTFV